MIINSDTTDREVRGYISSFGDRIEDAEFVSTNDDFAFFMRQYGVFKDPDSYLGGSKIYGCRVTIIDVSQCQRRWECRPYHTCNKALKY